MRKLFIIPLLLVMVGCNSLDRIMNGEPKRRDTYDNTPNPYYIEGVTSFDYDTVYNVPTFDHIEVEHPGETSYWTINIYEYQYDQTNRTVHFGKMVAVSGNNITVENSPVAPVGTKYRIAVN